MMSDELKLIKPDRIIYSLISQNREDAFAEMIDTLIEGKLLAEELRQEILNALEEREAEMSTAIGRELAIPHASIHDLPSVVRLLARSEKGIGQSDSDGLPVRYYYLSLIPSDDYSTHLRTVAAISSFFRNDSKIEQLKSAASENELEKLFTHS